MPEYDSVRFDPPAPAASVLLRNPGADTRVDNVLMLLDSGADVTLLPAGCVQSLSLSINASDVYELAGFDGGRSVAQAVYLDLVFAGQTFRGRFLLVNAETGIIGRDILNHVRLLLDGPGRQWQRT